MVPAADLLNHRTGWNNARLYFEADALHMVTITPVAAGAQLSLAPVAVVTRSGRHCSSGTRDSSPLSDGIAVLSAL
ncbi:hypothetical protein I4F81_001435 [Pyropia yezoensis]|uniref:Uncharacterized protein n=1 Tax=Pyropia yezoensis TaxID=2788 RepID=A0ACC3BLL1_PYRYE|nr:hypothetical protein I4F81_001435 [Neopyropia yezoensis]